MNALFSETYKSPSRCGLIRCLEDTLIAADESWWTGRQPLHCRLVAEVPCALYLNFLVQKSYVARLAPPVFRPLDLPGNKDMTLFTILLFTLERARPLWAPRIFDTLAKRFMQSNWRFYGHIGELGSESREGVLFIRTVTTSLLLSAFGRRLARCFPLHRAQRMTLQWRARQSTATIEPGVGSAPGLMFEGEQAGSEQVRDVFCDQFASYQGYAHWIIDQHLSLVTWPREYVVQDMHLDFQAARISPLRCLRCCVSGLEDLVPDQGKPFDCFLVEGLTVFLDNIYALDRMDDIESGEERNAGTRCGTDTMQ